MLGYAPLRELKVIDLDTAKPLATLKEGKATFAKLDVPIVDDKQSARLKVSGSVQDPAYRVENGTFVFERAVRGLRNTVLLPAGWEAAGVSQSCTLGTYQGEHSSRWSTFSRRTP